MKRPVPVPGEDGKALIGAIDVSGRVALWWLTYALGRACGLWQVRLWVALACWSASTARGVFACC